VGDKQVFLPGTAEVGMGVGIVGFGTLQNFSGGLRGITLFEGDFWFFIE
jgi:hypothetical protein